jgi:subtilisin family serine protease
MPPEWDIDVNLAMETIIAESRSGKGTINVKSNGNSFYSSDGWCGPNNSMDDEMPCTTASSSGGLHTTPFIVGVPSLNANDERSSYSTVGPSSWIAGYGGEFGYGPPNYLAENYSEEQQRYFKAAVMSTDQSTCDVGYIRTENDPGTPRNAFSTGDHPLNLDCDYMPHMNGTSAAGPTVAGVIALAIRS